jgi:glycosyltransferase involved in cell wall biosynthesis
MQLSIVLPCRNEEANIEHVVRDCESFLRSRNLDGEVIVVNDGSTDGTRTKAEELSREFSNVKIISHDVNQGYGAAIRTGVDHAAGDLVCFMDSDGQFHAEDIGTLMDHLGTTDFISGIRIKRADPWNRKLNAFLYGTLVRFVLNVRVKDLNCGLKLFKRSIWPDIRPVNATGALFNAEVFLRLRRKGFTLAETGVQHYPRLAGEQTGAKLGVVLMMFKELLALRFHTKNKRIREALKVR